MTPEEIRARLVALREAGAALRKRPAAEIVDALGRTLDAWSAPDSPWRRRVEHELPGASGFSPETVREGLAVGLAGWNGDALRRLVADEIGPLARLDGAATPAVSGFGATALVLAGAIPMPSLSALLFPLVLRSPVLAKAASRDPVTPKLVARSIAEADAELSRCVAVVAFPGGDAERLSALVEADCVVATGSDEAVEAVRRRVEPPRRFVAHGHRLSVAAVGAEATRGEALRAAAVGLARDVALWDQLGCLSPLAVWVQGRADALAEALAEQLGALERHMPRGSIDARAAAAIAFESAQAELRAAAGAAVALHAGPNGAWTVVREADAAPRPAPLHRFVRVHPVEGPEELLRALAPLGPHLAGVALAGHGRATPELARRLAGLGASRICAPGALQAPPLAWRRDGAGVLTPLARYSDLEIQL